MGRRGWRPQFREGGGDTPPAQVRQNNPQG